MGSSDEQKRISVKVSLNDSELSNLKKFLGTPSLDPKLLAASIHPKISWFEEKMLSDEISGLRSGVTRLKQQIKTLTKENAEMETKLKIARSDGSRLLSKVEALENTRSKLEVAWNSKKNSKARWTLRGR